jgi:signal peptidase II
LIIGMFIIILAMDLATKYWAYNYLREVRSIPVIENIFHLTYVENRGAAFGILQDQRWVFVVVTIATLIFILWYLYQMEPEIRLLRIGLNLIFVGAVGNLIDRIYLGFVVDFIDFRIFPVWNVADMAIVIGTIITIAVIIFYEKAIEKGL